MSDLISLSAAWLRSDCYVDLTTRQMALLGIICDEPGPHHVRHLAVQMRVGKPIITRALDRFTALGMVQRVRSSADRRDVIVHATPAGKALRNAMRGVTA